MKILLHICCAPCSIYPLRELRANGAEVTGYFFNHNIHPYQEYRKRLDAVLQFSEQSSLPLICQDEYRLEEFLSAVASEPDSRCRYCYASRLEKAAQTAAEQGFPAFTSSLLYSRYQNHDTIRAIGEELANRYGVSFHYDDYRRGWQEGIRESKEMGLYRQQYCGCIYSEKERYAPQHSISQGADRT
jgi:predicted adenine nucleotide alpha hydrolase (AANH) superfamily ATPase